MAVLLVLVAEQPPCRHSVEETRKKGHAKLIVVALDLLSLPGNLPQMFQWITNNFAAVRRPRFSNNRQLGFAFHGLPTIRHKNKRSVNFGHHTLTMDKSQQKFKLKASRNYDGQIMAGKSGLQTTVKCLQMAG